MKVLVTGGSGLLGSRMLKCFPSDWQVTGTYHQHPAPGLIQCSLSSLRSLARLLQEGGYDCVVHCAAIRSPDACEEDPRRAVDVNAHGTELLARAASNARAKLVYASTDAVFAGDAPPYREQDRPAPLSVYGRSKLAGEKHALAVPGALVVRMPALYSADLGAPNNILAGLKESLEAGKPVPADEQLARYYTLAEDVAAAVAFLVAGAVRGIVHFSADERSTKLEFLRAAAEAIGLDAGLVQPAELPAGSAARPVDSHLDTGLYRSLGGPPFEGYRQALARLSAALRPGPL